MNTSKRPKNASTGKAKTFVLAPRDTAFNRQLSTLMNSGGSAQKSAEMILKIIGDITSFGTISCSRTTHHGESRIEGCVKYDLVSGYRLVTVQQRGLVIFLYCGSHDDCEKWLNRHKGYKYVYNKDSKTLTPIHWDYTLNDERPPITHIPVSDIDKPLIKLLPEKYIDRLPNLSMGCSFELNNIKKVCDDRDIETFLERIENADIQTLYLNVLLALREEQITQACAHIDLYNDILVTAEKDPDAVLEALEDEQNWEDIIDLTEISPEDYSHLVSHSFEEWMLYLHPSQRRVAYEDFEGPVMLKGISGSGKTCVLVHRAKYLAEKYPEDSIGVFALNEALAELIKELLNLLCPDYVRHRIRVYSVAQICTKILRKFEPNRHLMEFDPRSTEDLDDCWREFYDRDTARKTLSPILDSLTRTHKISPEEYLRDEFTWIRSAFCDSDNGCTIPTRDSYTDPKLTPRPGRSIAFSTDWRERTLDALRQYEEYLYFGGFVDVPARSLLAVNHVEALKSTNGHSLEFRSVLIDEAQDLGTVELAILSSLAPEKVENNLFLCGDTKQQVFPKDHDIAVSGIELATRRYFRKNYRNTKQILQAGLSLINTFGDSPMDKDDEYVKVDPQLSSRESSKPLVVECKSEAECTRYISEAIASKRRLDSKPICIVTCIPPKLLQGAMERFEQRFRAEGLHPHFLKRTTKIMENRVYISDLETVKGFEFSLVIIHNCISNNIPSFSLPKDERWRDARKLYVAMTRARDELVFANAGEPSEFLKGIKSDLIWSTGRDQL